MRLLIANVGRNKKSTTIDVVDGADADGIAECIYQAVRKMNALMSRDVDCSWDAETRTGGVYAGGRRVGDVSVATEPN